MEKPSEVIKKCLTNEITRDDLDKIYTDILKRLSPNMREVANVAAMTQIYNVETGRNPDPLTPYNVLYLAHLAQVKLGLDPRKKDCTEEEGEKAFKDVAHSLESSDYRVKTGGVFGGDIQEHKFWVVE